MMQKHALHAYSPPGPRQSLAVLARILFWQTMAGLLIGALAFGIAGKMAGISALAGIVVCLLPNLIFALRIAPGMLRQAPKQVMNSFYTAELFKVAATILLFIAAFRLVSPLQPGWLFGAYLATQFSIIIAASVADHGN